MRRLISGFLSIFLIVPMLALADSPVTMLQNSANQMISQLEKNKSQLKNKKVIHQIVNSVLVPHIEMNRMAASVVGRNYWMAATPEQQQQFIQEFKYLVINTYANALSSYNGDRVEFYPMRGGENAQAVQVKSVIIRLNGQRIPISYNVTNTGGVWKVYDFSIEGVSIVNNYQSQFANTLTQGGLPLLIKQLYSFNRAGQKS